MDTISNKKMCRACQINKNLDEFTKDYKMKDGYKPLCKLCRNQKDRNTYKLRTRDDEISLVKQQLIEKEAEYWKAVLLTDDPDSLIELKEKHNKDMDEYIRKLSERSLTSHFTIVNQGQDDVLICGKIQEHLMSKRIMIIPDQISIERSDRIIKISLPNEIKLNHESVVKISEMIKNVS
jgi:hypothetical protein